MSVFGDYPSLDCTEAMAVDSYGNVLFTRDAYTPMPMASITKTMTCIVALESGVPLETICTVSEYADEVDGSSVEYNAGSTATLYDLLRGLMVHSGNDCAIAIAENIAGSEAAFVEMMNAKAVELGLTSTSFANPHGLDEEGHYSSPRDLITLVRYAWENPLFKTICGTYEVTLNVNGEAISFVTTDSLLNVYPGMRGVKTGYTYGAGNAFLGCATRGGVTIFTVVLGCETSSSRFENTANLLDWAFSHYPEQSLSHQVATAPFADRFGFSVPVMLSYDPSVRISPFGDTGAITATYLGPYDDMLAGLSYTGCFRWYTGDSFVAASTTATGVPEFDSASLGPLREGLLS